MSDEPKLDADMAPGFERDLVERYTERLLDLARRQLPVSVSRRLDPQDVVQSVYRSFFQRLREGRFSFEDSGDMWRLLAAMTFQKAREAGKFHHRQRRNARRDVSLADDSSPADPEPSPDDLAVLVECLDLLVARMPVKYREIAIHRLNGDSIEQIATKVGRSSRTVLRAMSEMERLATRWIAGSEA